MVGAVAAAGAALYGRRRILVAGASGRWSAGKAGAAACLLGWGWWLHCIGSINLGLHCSRPTSESLAPNHNGHT